MSKFTFIRRWKGLNNFFPWQVFFPNEGLLQFRRTKQFVLDKFSFFKKTLCMHACKDRLFFFLRKILRICKGLHDKFSFLKINQIVHMQRTEQFFLQFMSFLSFGRSRADERTRVISGPKANLNDWHVDFSLSRKLFLITQTQFGKTLWQQTFIDVITTIYENLPEKYFSSSRAMKLTRKIC